MKSAPNRSIASRWFRVVKGGGGGGKADHNWGTGRHVSQRNNAHFYY